MMKKKSLISEVIFLLSYELKKLKRDTNFFVDIILFEFLILPLIVIFIGDFVSIEKKYKYAVDEAIFQEVEFIIQENDLSKIIDIVKYDDLSEEKIKKLILDTKVNAGIIDKDGYFFLYYESKLTTSKSATDFIYNMFLKENISIGINQGYDNIIFPEKLSTDDNIDASHTTAISIITIIIMVMVNSGGLSGQYHILKDKENQILPTLLVSNMKRISYMIDKFIVIIVTALIRNLAIILGLAFFGFFNKLFFGTELNPLDYFAFTPNQVILILLVILPIVFLYTSIIEFIGAISSNLKTAGKYLSPISLLIQALSITAFSEFELYSFIYYIPIVSTAMCIKNVLLNNLSIVNHLLPNVIVNIGLGLIIFFFTHKLYQNNELLLKE